MAEGDAASKVRCRDKREEECANFQVLGKLPPELWQKITDGLESDDLSPDLFDTAVGGLREAHDGAG